MNLNPPPPSPAIPTIHLEKLHDLLRVNQWEELRRELQRVSPLLTPQQRPEAAVLALQAGLPALGAEWAEQTTTSESWQIAAAAWLRLGDTSRALALLNEHASHEDGAEDTPRITAMRARAKLLEGDLSAASELAAQAHAGAFDAGDAPALLAAIAMLGEAELRGALDSGSRTGLHAALNILAEGLSIAETIHAPADPHILALVSLTQQRIKGGLKAKATAQNALDRSLAFSPSSVLALTVLGRHEEARGQAEAGALADGWWTWAQGE